MNTTQSLPDFMLPFQGDLWVVSHTKPKALPLG